MRTRRPLAQRQLPRESGWTQAQAPAVAGPTGLAVSTILPAASTCAVATAGARAAAGRARGNSATLAPQTLPEVSSSVLPFSAEYAGSSDSLKKNVTVTKE